MTLNEFSNLHVSNMGEANIYVFDTESDLDSFVNGTNDYELLCTLHSSYVCSVYLKPEIANAQVVNFSAVRRNSVAVWITTPDGRAETRRKYEDQT